MGAKSVLSAGGDHVELSIEGVIGDDWWTDDPVTGASVGKLLKAAPNAKTIDVSINSIGGDFFDGVQIYQLLTAHPARVTSRIGAVAASAASVVAMAGDEIVAHETSNVLIHRPWTCACGNEDDLRRVATDLATLNESLVSVYLARTDMSDEALRALLVEDRYMGAKEALELGFLTSVLPSKAKDSVSPEQARTSLERLRAQVLTRHRPVAVAVPGPAPAAVQPAQPTKPAPPSAKERTNVNLALIVAALGLAESATESEVVKEIQALKANADGARKVCDKLGAKSADEAVEAVASLQANQDGASKAFATLGVKGADEVVGAVAALSATCKESQADLKEMGVEVDESGSPIATAVATISAFRTGREKAEREAIIKQLSDEAKCTPAQKKDLFPTLSLASLKAFAATAQPIRLLEKDGVRQPGNGPTGAKSLAEMTPAEQRELAISDPALYDQLQAQAKAG